MSEDEALVDRAAEAYYRGLTYGGPEWELVAERTKDMLRAQIRPVVAVVLDRDVY